MKPETNPDPETVQRMFGRLAFRYDIFNRLSSLGLDTFWRREALRPVTQGMKILDLGCGTGDLALGAARKLKGHGGVTGLDFSKPMLEIAEKRLKKLGSPEAGTVHFVLRKAEELPIDEAPYDLVLSGFVLRNLYENIDPILSGVYRSIKKGGQISFLDFTEPPNPALRALWRFYMNSCVAFYGKLLFGREYPDRYMTRSAERFLKAGEFVKKLGEKGFSKIRTRSFLFGIIVLYRATKS